MKDIPISRVGRLEARPGVRLAGGAEWPPALFAHFAAARGRHRSAARTGEAS